MNSDCTACRLLGRQTGHTCGEYRDIGPILRDTNADRRQEAEETGECLDCFGAGFVWSYARAGTGAAFQDQFGWRYLVRCQRCKGADVRVVTA